MYSKSFDVCPKYISIIRVLTEFTEDPVNTIFSSLYEYQKEKVKKEALLLLFCEMYKIQSHLGYYLLCYLKAR